MAEAMHRRRCMRPFSREAIIDRRQSHMRWGAVLAGTVLSIGLWILLQTIGMGIGLAAVDTDDAGNLRGIGIGTGVWSVIAPLIAIFLGAMLAGRLAGTRHGGVGAMHGAVMWALTSVLGLWAMISIVQTVTSTATRVGSAAVGATSSVVSGAVSAGGDADIMKTLGVDENDLLGPVNQQLQEQGKPPITAEQLRSAMKNAAQRGLREGKLDREMLKQELAKQTALSPTDVEQLSQQIGDRYDAAATDVREKVSDVGEKAEDVALTAADKTGKVLLGAGIALLLGLLAGLGGGALGARMAARERREDIGPLSTTPVPPPGETVVTTTTHDRDADDRFIGRP